MNPLMKHHKKSEILNESDSIHILLDSDFVNMKVALVSIKIDNSNPHFEMRVIDQILWNEGEFTILGSNDRFKILESGAIIIVKYDKNYTEFKVGDHLVSTIYGTFEVGIARIPDERMLKFVDSNRENPRVGFIITKSSSKISGVPTFSNEELMEICDKYNKIILE